MRVYFKDFRLLKKGYYNIITVDLKDSMLISEDERGILEFFFDVDDYSTSWEDTLVDKAESYITTGTEGIKYLDTLIVTTDEDELCTIGDVMMLNGYLLFCFEIFAWSSHLGLLVLNMSDYSLVGFISSRYNTISTPDLARLVLATPEVDWSV